MAQSKKQIGLNYLEALKSLKERSIGENTVQITFDRVSRWWVVDQLGCSAGLLSSNAKVRRFLIDWDKSIGSDRVANPKPLPIVPGIDSDHEFLERYVLKNSPLHNTIEWTHTLKGKEKLAIPVLFDGNDISSSELDWCRKLAKFDDYSPGSLEGIVNVLRLFRNFTRALKLGYEQVTDNTFILWKIYMQEEGLTPERIRLCLRTAHAFFQFLESSNVIKFRVDIYDRADLPPEFAETYIFPISSKKILKKASKVEVCVGYTTPITVRGSPSLDMRRNTPTRANMKEAHTRALLQKHGVRNSIIMSVAETTGARVSEAVEIKISQLPSAAQLQEIIFNKETWQVLVHRKNRSGLCPLELNGYLLLRIFNYIQNERAAVVARYPDKSMYEDGLFLSDRGTPITADSITHIVIELLDGILERAGIHRLRSKFSVDELETLLKSALEVGIDVGPTSNWVESFLTIIAGKMGQSAVQSLRPYLPLVFGRRLATTKAAVVRELEIKLDEQSRLEADQAVRLAEQEKQMADNLAELQKYRELLRISQTLDPAKYERFVAYGQELLTA